MTDRCATSRFRDLHESLDEARVLALGVADGEAGRAVC